LEIQLLVPPLLAGTATASALHLMLAHASLPLDRPNERSLHCSLVPRSGGLAVVPAILLAWLLIVPNESSPVAVGAGVLFAVSLLDDLRGLPVGMRLVSHLATSTFVVISTLGTSPGWPSLAIAILAISWAVNAYNFMDGSDGLAGGMGVIGFGFYGIGAWAGGDAAFASACLTIAAAAAGFLAYNFSPSRVFLGDCGSIPLGLLAGSMGLLGWARGLWPPWFPVLVFSTFIVDATVTLVRRLLRGARVWQAHNEHYYQRLIRSGWSHRRTALAEYFVMLTCGVVAMTIKDLGPAAQAMLLGLVALGYACLIMIVDRAWDRHERFTRQPLQREG
jgi:UDP-N-acetylmuramyl pentapeptide phosphotransferase/UDP-N-acetylglucosamine-1-phosphate transferase